MMKYVWAAVAVLTLGLAISTIWTARSNAGLQVELASRDSRIAALEQRAADLARANAIAQAKVAEIKAHEAEIRAAAERILTTGGDDVPLDPDLADLLNGLLAQTAD